MVRRQSRHIVLKVPLSFWVRLYMSGCTCPLGLEFLDRMREMCRKLVTGITFQRETQLDVCVFPAYLHPGGFVLVASQHPAGIFAVLRKN